MNKTVFFLGCALLAAPALAQPLPAALAECAQKADPAARLACYDALQPPALSAESAPPMALIKPAPPAPVVAEEPKNLATAWDLDGKRELLAFRAYRPNYVLPAWYMANPNNHPQSPTRGEAAAPGADALNKAEVKFQLSFKTKLWQDMLGTPADLWFGYTQESHWQFYNKAHSSPFRETDYQPELMLTFPLPDRWAWGDTRLRMGGLGLVHQSNGRAEPLSRSWNRIYMMAALDNGPFTLQGRWWHRLAESADVDDNPDIVDYMGYGDLQAIYRAGEHTLSALWRPNFRSGKQGAQLEWSFPIKGKLRGYAQAYAGYGESLIDYNHRTRAIGIGLSLTDWLEK